MFENIVWMIYTWKPWNTLVEMFTTLVSDLSNFDTVIGLVAFIMFAGLITEE